MKKRCSRCNGLGHVDCAACRGTGKGEGVDFFGNNPSCHPCAGLGGIRCRDCDGRGKIKMEEREAEKYK